MREETYRIEGMSCAACSASIERVTRKLSGVVRSDVNLTTEKMDICYDELLVTPELIMQKVQKAGFGIKPYTPDKAKTADDIWDDTDLQKRKRDIIGAVLFTAILLYISMGQMLFSGLPVPKLISMAENPLHFAIAQLILTIPVLIFGRRFFTGGFKALFHLSPNMDSLVAIGSGCSFLYSLVMTCLIPQSNHYVHELYYESAAVVITLVMLGKYFEAKSKNKTKDAIKKLMELTPDTALLAENGETREVPSESLKAGDVVLIKPGARIPADGVVTEGEGSVNESMLTGESLPVEKAAGSKVTGGSVSYNGALYVKVERTGNDTTLSQIIRFVEDAQGKKAPVSKLADRIAGVFVPVVIGIAIAASVLWLIAGKDFSFILRIFVSVLVIACPCALGLATPTAIMVGTGLGAGMGILIRSGEALETVHNVTSVVLDKTGTVTTGTPVVAEVIAKGWTEEELMVLAASVEAVSEHPLAKAIMEKAQDLELEKLEKFENLSGMGIRASLADGREVLAGNRRLMDRESVSYHAFEEDIKRLSSTGQTPVMLAVNGEMAGVIGIADSIRQSSAEAIAHLKEMGIKVYLLTGDRREAAETIGSAVKADEVIAEVLPEDKANVVKSLQERGEIVMMVGDGINDAPALTQADTGAAIGAGSDIAIESGDIVLMRSDLNDVSRAIKLSRLTFRNIKQNLFWAFFYNILCIPIAAGILYPINGVLLNPMFAGFAMSLSSVCVVTNALRLRRKKI